MLVQSRVLTKDTTVDLLWDRDTNRYALAVDEYWCSGFHYTENEAMKWFEVITQREIVDIVTSAYAVGEH